MKKGENIEETLSKLEELWYQMKEVLEEVYFETEELLMKDDSEDMLDKLVEVVAIRTSCEHLEKEQEESGMSLEKVGVMVSKLRGALQGLAVEQAVEAVLGAIEAMLPGAIEGQYAQHGQNLY